MTARLPVGFIDEQLGQKSLVEFFLLIDLHLLRLRIKQQQRVL